MRTKHLVMLAFNYRDETQHRRSLITKVQCVQFLFKLIISLKCASYESEEQCDTDLRIMKVVIGLYSREGISK